jgi:hypothetical protein
LLAVPKRCGDDTPVPFSQDFQAVVDKTNLSLQDGQISFRVANLLEGTVYSGNGYAEFNTTGAKVLSNIAWLISPKLIWIHTNDDFRTAQHHLDVDSHLAGSICFSNFDGLNVTKATWTPLKVILPKQLVSVVSSGGVDLSSYTGKSISLSGTRSGKNLALDGAFQVDDATNFREVKWVVRH